MTGTKGFYEDCNIDRKKGVSVGINNLFLSYQNALSEILNQTFKGGVMAKRCM